MTDRPGNGGGNDSDPPPTTSAGTTTADETTSDVASSDDATSHDAAPGRSTPPLRSPGAAGDSDDLLLPMRGRSERSAPDAASTTLIEPSARPETQPAETAPGSTAGIASSGVPESVGVTSGTIKTGAADLRDSSTSSFHDGDAGDDASDGGSRHPRNRITAMVSGITIAAGLIVAVAVFAGRANSERYAIVCEPDRVVVVGGRAFPPWGTHPLEGAPWKPLKLPPEAECASIETTDVGELARSFLQTILKQTSALLTAREVTKIDDAEAQLQQALLVARSLTNDDARAKQRATIEQLLGDVAYWRASAKLRLAADSLADAANQFDAAAKQRPVHVSDAATWAAHVRKIVEALRSGPKDDQPDASPPVPPDVKPGAPPGVALPVEPPRDAGAPPSDPDAGGLPAGGVLL